MLRMLLGNARSRITNVNKLESAFHQEYGLVWVDGRCVNLSAITVTHNDIIVAPPTTLGQFEDADEACWSCSSTSHCFLSVQHRTTLSIWRVQPSSNLNAKFEKNSEIESRAISQGCVWNPCKLLLAVLCKDTIVIFDPENASKHTIHTDSTISRAVWSAEGAKLIVAFATNIQVYWLDDHQLTIHGPIINGFSGSIRAMVPVTPDLIAMTLDLPLLQLVQQSQVDMFEAVPFAELRASTGPRLQPATKLNSPESTKQNVDQRKSSLITRLETEIQNQTGPIDINALFKNPPNHDKDGKLTSNYEGTSPSLRTDMARSGVHSIPRGIQHDLSISAEPANDMIDLRMFGRDLEDKMIGLRFKQTCQDRILDSSRLVLVNLHGNVSSGCHSNSDCIISSVDLPCLINVDLLVFQNATRSLVVASNTHSISYQVSVNEDGTLMRRQAIDLKLSPDDRPIGLCTLPHTTDLLVLSRQSPHDDNGTFLPSSGLAEFRMKLRSAKLNRDFKTDDTSSLSIRGELSTLTLPARGRITLL